MQILLFSSLHRILEKNNLVCNYFSVIIIVFAIDIIEICYREDAVRVNESENKSVVYLSIHVCLLCVFRLYEES